MVTAYIDAFTYKRAVTGLEIDSLLGNLGRLSSAVSKNGTSLPVTPNVSIALKQFDPVYIFDGLNSEVCMVASDTASGASIPLLTGLQFDHAQYTTYCTDGTMGSLGDELLEASNWVENITQQSLYQQTYTNETLDIPSMRASIDNRGMLVFRPRHFPISADSGITLESSVNDAIDYDAAQIILNGSKQVVKVPWLLATNVSNNSNAAWGTPVDSTRGSNLFLLASYTAGYATLPGDIRDCAVLLTSEILARRQNPSGAVSIRLGDKQLQVTGARDNLGESLLIKAAKQKLQPYSVEAF
jgi:hypothetical protein